MKNISKIILGMVFVFGMTSMSDSNAMDIENEEECHDLALSAAQSLSYLYDLHPNTQHAIYGAIYDDCMD